MLRDKDFERVIEDFEKDVEFDMAVTNYAYAIGLFSLMSLAYILIPSK